MFKYYHRRRRRKEPGGAGSRAVQVNELVSTSDGSIHCVFKEVGGGQNLGGKLSKGEN